VALTPKRTCISISILDSISYVAQTGHPRTPIPTHLRQTATSRSSNTLSLFEPSPSLTIRIPGLHFPRDPWPAVKTWNPTCVPSSIARRSHDPSSHPSDVSALSVSCSNTIKVTSSLRACAGARRGGEELPPQVSATLPSRGSKVSLLAVLANLLYLLLLFETFKPTRAIHIF
jgi:hypothetical protein